MAPQILGKSGAYSKVIADRYQDRIINTTFWFVLPPFFLSGIGLGAIIGRHYSNIPEKVVSGVSILAAMFVLAAMLLGGRRVESYIDDLRRIREQHLKGIDGESLTEAFLMELGPEYLLVNGVKSPCGDIDHLVVGPNGIWVIETKNWTGLVAGSDTGDQLLYNNHPSYPGGKNPVEQVGQRSLDIRTILGTATSRADLFVQPVLVFPSAFIDQRKSSVAYRSVKVPLLGCKYLAKYIITHKPKPLSKEQFSEIAEVITKHKELFVSEAALAASEGGSEPQGGTAATGSPKGGAPDIATPSNSKLLRSRRDRKK